MNTIRFFGEHVSYEIIAARLRGIRSGSCIIELTVRQCETLKMSRMALSSQLFCEIQPDSAFGFPIALRE